MGDKVVLTPTRMISRSKLFTNTRIPRLFTLPKETETYLHEAGAIDDVYSDHGKAAIWKAKKLKLRYKGDYKKLVKDKWNDKTMNGKFPKYLDKDYVDTELSFKWMKYTGLKGGTEGLIIAAQDQSLNTRYYSTHISKQGTTETCIMCHNQPDTVEHIISGCQ